MAFTWKDKITASTGTIRGDLWTRLREGDLSVKKFKKMKEGDTSAWWKASAIVHTTAEQVLAFVWLYCSNLRMKEHQKKDGNLLRVVYEPFATDTVTVLPAQHNTQHIVVQKSMPPPFRPRETNVRYVWGIINNSNNNSNNNNNKHPKTLIMAFEPAKINFISEQKGRTISKKMSKSVTRPINTSVHPTNSKEGRQNIGIVQLETRGLWVITPLAQDLCEVTLVTNIVDKGKIPTSIINASIGRTLNAATFHKAFYERNGLVVDAEVSERRERASHVKDEFLPTKPTHSASLKMLTISLHFARRSCDPSSSRTFPER